MQILVITPAGKTIKMNVVDEPDCNDMDMPKVNMSMSSIDLEKEERPSTSRNAKQLRFLDQQQMMSPVTSRMSSVSTTQFSDL